MDVVSDLSYLSREDIVGESPEEHDGFVGVRDVDEQFVLFAGKLCQVAIDSTFEGHLQ
jgi:hypothetical protein